MGAPLSLSDVAAYMGTHRAGISGEIKSGRLRVSCLIGNRVVIDADDFEEWRREYAGDGLMTETEIARYLGLGYKRVKTAMHKYHSIATVVCKGRSAIRYYDIDSTVVQHIFKILGWEKYVRLDGHKRGITFASETERRRATRAAGHNRLSSRERGISEADSG